MYDGVIFNKKHKVLRSGTISPDFAACPSIFHSEMLKGRDDPPLRHCIMIEYSRRWCDVLFSTKIYVDRYVDW